jgi:hypothetical protein
MSATIDISDGIASRRYGRRQGRTPVNPPLVAALNACLDRAEREAKAVILAGRPQRFSGGFDLKLMAASPREEVTALVKSGGRLAMPNSSGFPLPVVAACTGHCIAMGVFLLLGCDFRLGAAGPFKIGANGDRDRHDPADLRHRTAEGPARPRATSPGPPSTPISTIPRAPSPPAILTASSPKTSSPPPTPKPPPSPPRRRPALRHHQAPPARPHGWTPWPPPSNHFRPAIRSSTEGNTTSGR